jgi:LmbE family N-acetylglucosaminyl deacetylase
MELEYLDAQYSPQRPDAGVVGDAIADAVKRAGALSVIAPLGISHADHRLVAEASERARKQLGDINWYVYGDLPYFHEPGGEQQALGIREGLAEQGVRLSPLQGSAAFPPKTAALDLYTSQRKGLGEQRIQIALKPERYWRVTRP